MRSHSKFILSVLLSFSVSAFTPVTAPAASIESVLEGIGADSSSASIGSMPPESGPVIGRVTAQYKLNVRNAPEGKIIDGFLPGTSVDILAREGEWYRIRYGKETAYVHTTLVTVESGTPRVVTPEIKLPAAGTVTAKYLLNVRRSAWGEIIDGFKPGTKVNIIGCEGEWYIITHGDGKAYVHSELVKVDKAALAENGSDAQVTQPAQNNAKPENKENSDSQAKQTADGGINGPSIPAELRHGIEAAMRTQWYTTQNKCLQYAGTVAHEAGAPAGAASYTQPQAAWPADTSLRGYYINELSAAVNAGKLLPGMLIHVKIHYDMDPAYNPINDAHHWFVYMGKDAQGVPRFADNLRGTNLQTADQVHNYLKGGSGNKYGDAKYGYIRRVTATYDPFASVR